MRAWLGVLGAPLAWTGQHVAGFALAEADCSAVVSVDLDAWTTALTIAAAAVAVAAAGASVLAYRDTRDAGDSPPASRIRFLAQIGMTIAPLFLALILMNGIGVLSLPGCRQS